MKNFEVMKTLTLYGAAALALGACAEPDSVCPDGSEPVQCFADPCSVTPACAEAVSCVANYCGGCNAEFFDARGNRVCLDASGDCSSDADCTVTGCSGQICAAEPVVSTCEFRPEYACYADPEITGCGCNAGRCDWARTDELAECLANGGPSQ
jgi:eight-cysteine-cluster-containing protein